jgi:uncharacterized protein YbaR (Trm112 family)
MDLKLLDVLGCPRCHGVLTCAADVAAGTLRIT